MTIDQEKIEMKVTVAEAVPILEARYGEILRQWHDKEKQIEALEAKLKPLKSFFNTIDTEKFSLEARLDKIAVVYNGDKNWRSRFYYNINDIKPRTPDQGSAG